MMDAAIFAEASSIFSAPSAHAFAPQITCTETANPSAAVRNNLIRSFLAIHKLKTHTSIPAAGIDRRAALSLI
jgi:hypothetical protein